MPITLSGLENRHPGLTKEIAACYVQAASVCLDRHHQSPLRFAVDGGTKKDVFEVAWTVTSAADRVAWANTDDATRDGAYAVALAVIEQQERLVAVGRAWGRTGADYFVAPAGTPVGEFEHSTRLEISGVDSGDQKIVMARLSQKIEQTKRGDSDTPAITAVIGFKFACAMYSVVES